MWTEVRTVLKQLNNNCLKLVKFILRRERVISTIWLISLIAITVMVPLAFDGMYNSEADKLGMAMTMQNPAMVAMCGPVYGIDDYNIGAMTANEMILFTILAVAIMNIFLVLRHTRRDEERGRTEVVRSLPVGRLSNLTATMIIAFIVNAVLALLTGISLAVLNIEGMDLEGSMLYGVVLGVSGLLFAAITAVFAQLSSNSKGAMGYTFIVFGVLYIVRAMGDIKNETLARISPLGLILRTQVYVKNIWWPVFAVLLITAVIILIAFYLNVIRDMEQGFIPARKGREHASVFLQTPMGLGFKLLKATIISWFIGCILLGASYGSIMGDLESFLEGNALLQQALEVEGHSLTEGFLTMIMSVLSMFATIPVLTVMLKLRSEEKRNHTEHILSRSVSRNKIMSGYFVNAFINSIIIPLSCAFGLWAASYSVLENKIELMSLIRAMAVYMPAVWVMLGLTVLLIGWLPSKTSFAWIYLGISFLLVYLGSLLQLSDWIIKLSPYGYIPKLPMEEINYGTLTILTVVAVAMTAVGYIGYNKRDIEG